MAYSIEVRASEVLAQLRDATLTDPVENEGHIVPGCYFSWDEQVENVDLGVASEEGTLLQLNAQISGKPQWNSFNVALESGSVSAGDLIGVVVDITGGAGEKFPLFIRTSRGENISDTPLTEVLVGSKERSIQTLLHKVSHVDAVSGEEGYHTLVLALPSSNFNVTLHDLRLFVLPDGEGEVAQAPTLASYAM
ncbi:hypothetical protein [Shimia sp. MIT1388]|uniref:hypothetical protein n=1 Tax=Shimia sp. MIT1388 TaxID=3096992 RepID=UPI0039999435